MSSQQSPDGGEEAPTLMKHGTPEVNCFGGTPGCLLLVSLTSQLGLVPVTHCLCSVMLAVWVGEVPDQSQCGQKALQQ